MKKSIRWSFKEWKKLSIPSTSISQNKPSYQYVKSVTSKKIKLCFCLKEGNSSHNPAASICKLTNEKQTKVLCPWSERHESQSVPGWLDSLLQTFL